VFKITLNRELSTKLIQKNSLSSTAHESQISDKQKFHSAQNKDAQSVPKSWATDRLYCDYKEEPHLLDDLHS
jgi:hypothetical protein